MSRSNGSSLFGWNSKATPTAEGELDKPPVPEPRSNQAARDRARNSRRQPTETPSGGGRVAGHASKSEGQAARDSHVTSTRDLKSQLQQQESLINDLLAKVQSSEMKVQSSEIEVQQLQTALGQARQQAGVITDLSDKLLAAEAEIRQLQTKEQTLRDFMLHNANDQGSSEQAVINQYTRLGQSIHKLAMSKTYHVERSTSFASQGIWPQNDNLGALWEASSRPTRLLILRAAIFQTLHSKILSHEVFDVHGTDTHLVTDLAKVLGQFERTIVHQGGLSTFKCIKAAGLEGTDFGVQVAQDMYDVFSPLIAAEATQEEQTNLRRIIIDLCQEASALRLLMRKSREPYECWLMARGPLKDKLHLCDSFGEVAGDSTQTESLISFTLVGALVRYERFGSEEPRVLEKAQVIVTSN
ncbi:uncharacterized protein TrAtP1_008293 [Trichoderma atroviride]|uniref:uncharacterized protein n=1 Tax=Hypocrea atroviridis TaxID=63577 RepID=UPI00331F9E7F|nr:hypothetical protein TrAtP1_008293 [Trichoderma atroviride]